jgi:hypothetical protein
MTRGGTLAPSLAIWVLSFVMLLLKSFTFTFGLCVYHFLTHLQFLKKSQLIKGVIYTHTKKITAHA